MEFKVGQRVSEFAAQINIAVRVVVPEVRESIGVACGDQDRVLVLAGKLGLGVPDCVEMLPEKVRELRWRYTADGDVQIVVAQSPPDPSEQVVQIPSIAIGDFRAMVGIAFALRPGDSRGDQFVRFAITVNSIPKRSEYSLLEPSDRNR